MAFEKLGKMAYILFLIVSSVCILCEIVFGIGYYNGIITLDQFLLYSVCMVMLVEIIHDDREKVDEVKENNKKERGKKQ